MLEYPIANNIVYVLDSVGGDKYTYDQWLKGPARCSFHLLAQGRPEAQEGGGTSGET